MKKPLEINIWITVRQFMIIEKQRLYFIISPEPELDGNGVKLISRGICKTVSFHNEEHHAC
jgi:hypothetical protein